jgi:hypothetical protein
MSAAASDLEPGEAVRGFLERVILRLFHDLRRSQRGTAVRLRIGS